MQNGAGALSIYASKAGGELAHKLRGMGLQIKPLEIEGINYDRYVISNSLVIERRTGSTFIQGILDKTIFLNAIELRENFDRNVLIIEGILDYSYRAINPQAVRGAISALIVLYQSSILQTADIHETAAIIRMLTEHEINGVPPISLVPKRKAVDLADMQRRVIEMLPGVGRVLARDLLQHYGSIRRIMEEPKDKLEELRGIGHKKAEEIHQVFNSEYRSVDSERQIEDAIVFDHSLLFYQPVLLLARQHYIYSANDERHFVDLIFEDSENRRLYLVELKIGMLTEKDEVQLLRYLDQVERSPLLIEKLRAGLELRGVLATVDDHPYFPQSKIIEVCQIDRQRLIDILVQMRIART
jgi:ERCC4-type nuclease